MRRAARGITVVLMILLAGRALSEGAGEMLEKLQRKFDSLQDASVSFTKHVVFGVTKSEQDFTGTLFVKKGNKYRIESEDQTVVTDGISVWTFSRANNQVFIDHYKEDPKSFSPDKILVNIPGRYSATLLGKETIGRLETSVLKLVPREEKSNIRWMKLWVDRDEWLMKRIQVLDIGDNLTTYEIVSVKLNAGIPDSEFVFKAPADVEVIDVR
ncbi:MAG: hypothetical protein AUI33_18090 [Ignavibacteria bacterium 13_1_40CM_2_61_4]|nr:MAG: hypothetical protein AUI33_18090 [Ignavibacteria bacterium 13_1_40CM_2_61_4]